MRDICPAQVCLRRRVEVCRFVDHDRGQACCQICCGQVWRHRRLLDNDLLTNPQLFVALVLHYHSKLKTLSLSSMTGRVVHGPQVPGVCHAEELHFLFRWNVIRFVLNQCCFQFFVFLLLNHHFLYFSSSSERVFSQSNTVGDAEHSAKRKRSRGEKTKLLKGDLFFSGKDDLLQGKSHPT